MFKLLGQVGLVLLFLYFAYQSAVQDAALLATLAAVGAFILASVLLPLESIRESLEWIQDGGFGSWLYGIYLWLIPGRSPSERNRLERRGSIDLSSLFAFAMVVVLVSSLFVAGFAGVSSADDSDTDLDHPECSSVTHDSYLTDASYADEFENESEIESTDRNIYTKLEETDMFVRLSAENPNSYCVEMTVQIHPDIIPPADVGELSDTDGDVESRWRNVHDFDAGQSYTEITFRLDAESEVTFAPNRVRVLGIAWKDSQTDPSGWLDRLTSQFTSEGDLEESTYRLNSTEGSIVTVPLEHEGGQTIDEWQAVYRVDENRWRPITTDSDDPAFYRTVDGGDSLQLHFDTDAYPDGEVEVEFTANPGRLDSIKHDFRSNMASWADLFNFDFWIIQTPPVEVQPWT